MPCTPYYVIMRRPSSFCNLQIRNFFELATSLNGPKQNLNLVFKLFFFIFRTISAQYRVGFHIYYVFPLIFYVKPSLKKTLLFFSFQCLCNRIFLWTQNLKVKSPIVYNAFSKDLWRNSNCSALIVQISNFFKSFSK